MKRETARGMIGEKREWGRHMDLNAPMFAGLLRALEGLRPGGAVAIDGRCGSGKSTLAAALAARFPCQVVHMDDFYLPQSARAADWMEHPAGNMDLVRLEREVLTPLRTRGRAEYRPFVCRTGELGQPVRLTGGVTLVEGSYSHHPALADGYDLRIFLTCTPAAQLRRIRAREGDAERVRRFQTVWIPLEERYFQTCCVPERADLILDTSDLF